MSIDSNQFNRIAKALADPRRFEILEIIAASSDGLCCGDIVECFSVAQPTVSHHLKELADAGLVDIRPQGQFSFFKARTDVLADYIFELQRRTGMKRKSGESREPRELGEARTHSARR